MIMNWSKIINMIKQERTNVKIIELMKIKRYIFTNK